MDHQLSTTDITSTDVTNQLVTTNYSTFNPESDHSTQYNTGTSPINYDFKLSTCWTAFGISNIIPILHMGKTYKLEEHTDTERYFEFLDLLNQLTVIHTTTIETQTVTKYVTNGSAFTNKSYMVPLNICNLTFDYFGKKNVYVLYEHNIIYIYTKTIQELYYFMNLRKNRNTFGPNNTISDTKTASRTISTNSQITIYEARLCGISSKIPTLKCYAKSHISKTSEPDIYIKFLKMLTNTIYYNPDITYKSIELDTSSSEPTVYSIPQHLCLINYMNRKKHAYLYYKDGCLYIYTKKMAVYTELTNYIDI